MTSSTTLRAGVVRLVVLALLASTLAVVASTGPARAENPPAFITSWGTPGQGEGQFDNPRGLAVDADGNVYVADTFNNRIQEFTSDGTFIRQWGTSGTGDGEFTNPFAVGVNSTGNVYVADTGNGRIQEFTPEGTFIAEWGTGSEFNNPSGLAFDGDGNVYVADTNGQRIQKFTADGTFITTWGTRGSDDGQFIDPVGIAVDAEGNVYVGERFNNRVQKFTSDGDFVTKWGSNGTGDGQFTTGGLLGVAVDARGHVYVADTGAHRIQEFTADGAFVTKWGVNGSGNGQFNAPYGVAVDSEGKVYVADTNNYRIQKFGDVIDPTVDLRTPAEGAVYARNQAVAADFSCADEVGGSGIATCEGTVADGLAIDSSTVGDHDFTVTASDVAGNTTEVTNTYTVSDPRPDGRIKKGATGALKGNNIYNTTGADQTRTGSAARGGTVTYFVSVQNDAPFPDALRVRGTATNTRFRVAYTAGSTDITPQVTAGTYTTPALAPRATFTVKVVVTVRSTAPAGSSLTGSLVSRSNTNPAIRDTVEFVTRRA